MKNDKFDYFAKIAIYSKRTKYSMYSQGMYMYFQHSTQHTECNYLPTCILYKLERLGILFTLYPLVQIPGISRHSIMCCINEPEAAYSIFAVCTWFNIE